MLTFKNICASFNPVFFLLFCCLLKYTCMCPYVWHVGQCMCMCLCVFVCHLEESQFYYDSSYSRHHSYKMPYSEEVMVLLMFVELNELMYCYTIYWFMPSPNPPKQKRSLHTDFFFSHIFIHRRGNKCAHKANRLRTLKYFFMVSSTFVF